MNEAELIFERYKSILNEKFEIVYPVDEYGDEDWEKAEAAEAIMKKVNVRPSRDKNLSLVAELNDEVIGAVYTSVSHNQDAEQYNAGERGKQITVFSFDIGIDPKHQGGTVAYELVKTVLNDFQNQANEFGKDCIVYNYVINPVMARMLERFFGYEMTTESEHEGYYANMIKFL